MNTIQIYKYVKIVCIKKYVSKFIYHFKHDMIRKKNDDIKKHKHNTNARIVKYTKITNLYLCFGYSLFDIDLTILNMT